jgi:hypothetical protein
MPVNTGSSSPNSSVPVSENPTSPEPQVQASSDSIPQAPATPFDSAAMEQELRESFGPDFSMKDLSKRVRALNKSNTELGRVNAEMKRANEPRDEFWKMVDANEPLRTRLGQTMEEFLNENPNSAPVPDIGRVMLEQRLNNIETQHLTAHTDQELDKMASSNYPVTDEMRDEVHAEVLASNGRYTPKQIYMMKFGDIAMQIREREAANAAIESLKANNNVYVQGTPQRTAATPSQPPVDVSGMSSGEFAKYAVSRWKEKMGERRW